MSGGTNLAQVEPELAGLSGLRAGATGGPAYRSPAEQQAELRRAQRQRGWDDATPLLREEAAAYREVMGPRVKRQKEPTPGRSSFL
jgi:hypothetical protein